MVTNFFDSGASLFLLASTLLFVANNIPPANAFQPIQPNCNSISHQHSQTHLHSFNDHEIKPTSTYSRRNIFKTTISALVPLQYLVSSPKVVNAESPSDLPNGLLESRVLENVLSPPPYGIESSDILYPSYFNGVWDVQSKTQDIIAPCGIGLFGGNYTYSKAQNEIGTTLSYKSRFIPSSDASINAMKKETDAPIIADREYNVVEIAKSAMGINAVLDVPVATPNKVSVILSPAGANQLFQADLLTLNRRSENISPYDFHCSEVVRQIIAPMKGNGGAAKSSSLLKEIETASLYTASKEDDGSVKTILCRQRSATFLLPSQQDPMAYKMWEMSRGRPIDVRYYDIIYTKLDKR